MVNTIITIGSVITAVSIIITCFVTLYKFIRKVDKKIENFEQKQKDTQLSVLRLTIINDKMPLDERVDAGEQYVEMGGNGSVHVLYDVLRKEYESELKRK